MKHYETEHPSLSIGLLIPGFDEPQKIIAVDEPMDDEDEDGEVSIKTTSSTATVHYFTERREDDAQEGIYQAFAALEIEDISTGLEPSPSDMLVVYERKF